MNYNLNIQKILLEIDKQSNPTDRIALLKQAIQLADANNDLDWGFDLRISLIRNEGYTSHCVDSFPAFTWLLNTYDNNSDLFDEIEILYEYRWLASQAFRKLDITRIQIESILSDYQTRLLRNGFSNRVYYDTMTNWHLFLGEKVEARKCLELRDNEPFDKMSSSTELLGTMCVELFEGKLDKGIVTANEFLDQKTIHQMNPVPTYCLLISYLSKSGDPRAQYYFEKAEDEYTKVKKYSYQLYEVLLMMFYLAKHDQEKAWTYFEQYAEWEINTDDATKFDFWLSVLPLLETGGNRKLNLSSKLPYYREDSMYNISEMYETYRQKVYQWADAFDARNGNRHFHEQITEYLG